MLGASYFVHPADNIWDKFTKEPPRGMELSAVNGGNGDALPGTTMMLDSSDNYDDSDEI